MDSGEGGGGGEEEFDSEPSSIVLGDESVDFNETSLEQEISENDIIDEVNVEPTISEQTVAEEITPEDFMDEEKQEIDDSMKKKYYNYLRGVRINNTLASAKKDILVDLKNKWSLLDDYHISTDKSYLLNILVDAKLRAASDNHLIMSVPTEMTVIKVMDNIKEIEDIILNVLEVNDYKLTAASEVEWARIKDDYIKKIKSGQNYNTINEQTLNEYYDIKDKREELLSKAVDYFGSDMIVEG